MFKYQLKTGKVKEIIIDKDIGIYKGYVEELNSPIYVKAETYGNSYFPVMSTLFYMKNNKAVRISLEDTYNHKEYWSYGRKIGGSFWKERQALIVKLGELGIKSYAIETKHVYQLNEDAFCFIYRMSEGWNTILYVQ